MEYEIGDPVACKVNINYIDVKETIETIIIGKRTVENKYFFYLIAAKGGYIPDISKIEEFSIPKDYQSHPCWCIHSNDILFKIVKVEKVKPAGCYCFDCKQFINMGEPNRQHEGKDILVCYSCRTNKTWKWAQ